MPENYLHAAIEIAQEAGKVLVEELSRPLDIAYKGDEVDLVTQADKRSERLIVERLTKYFPEHAIAAEEGTGHESNFAGTLIRWMARRISPMAIRASVFRSLSRSDIPFSPPQSLIRFTTNFSLPHAAKAPPSTARKSAFPKMRPFRRACSVLVFLYATESSVPIFNIMVTSRSTLTEYAAMVPPRSISPLWQPAALTVSGNSALRNGTLLPAFCWSKKPAAK